MTAPRLSSPLESRDGADAVEIHYLSLLDVSEPVRLFADGEWHETRVPHEREAGPDHLLGVEQLAECVASGAEPSLSADRAIHVLAVIAAARRAPAYAATRSR